MLNRIMLITVITGGLVLGNFTAPALAQMSHTTMPHETMEPGNQFRQIEQPLWLKGVVTVGGLSLMGLELWWFLFSQKTKQGNS